MLSQRAKYAVRAMIALAGSPGDDLTMIADIAERENIPRKFLEAILLDLRKSGLLYARRGRDGGYRLARPPERITVGEIIRLIDGHIAPIPCASRFAYRPCADCSDPATCTIRMVMVQVRDAAAAILDRQTLAELASRQQRLGISSLSFDI